MPLVSLNLYSVSCVLVVKDDFVIEMEATKSLFSHPFLKHVKYVGTQFSQMCY